jgi:glycosyl transferase family 25
MEFVKHVLYINLKSRPDRRQHVEQQLKLIGVNANRFDAIKNENGAIGCSLSHLKCLSIAKENNWPHVMIVEDDIKFLDPSLFTRQFNKFIDSGISYDVILVAGNNIPPYEKVNDSSIKVTRCQTTTGYIVKQPYYDTLINNMKTGVLRLMKEPMNHRLYAIDKYWFQLQEKDNWYLITPPSVTQREDYSDIEKRPTNYTNAMLDLDKPYLFTHK